MASSTGERRRQQHLMSRSSMSCQVFSRLMLLGAQHELRRQWARRGALLQRQCRETYSQIQAVSVLACLCCGSSSSRLLQLSRVPV